MKKRIYAYDWLRVLLIGAVFLFHCAMIFTPDWRLTNGTTSLVALVFTGCLDLWIMPVFFLLSGLSTWYALKSRNSRQFLIERVKRLMIPLFTVGLFLLNPPQFFIKIINKENYNGSFWESLDPYFQKIGKFSLDAPCDLIPVSDTAHLWFLQYLFLISLIALPLLKFLTSEKGKSFNEFLTNTTKGQGMIFIFVVPVIIIRVALQHFFFDHYYGWDDFFEFAFYFIIGFIFSANEHFLKCIKKNTMAGLVLGTLGFGILIFFVFEMDYIYPGKEAFSLQYVIFETVRGISRWSWVIFVIGIGTKHLEFNNKILSYGSEAVLPFYIVHQTIVLGIGWFIIPLQLGILPKFLIIVIASFALIMLIYEFLIRRYNAVRFLFGMRIDPP